MNLKNLIVPFGFEPIHAVLDWAKVRRLVRASRKGAPIPPMLVDGAFGNGILLAGTHRMAANKILAAANDECIKWVDLEDLSDADRNVLAGAVEDQDFRSIDEIWDGDALTAGLSFNYL